VSGQHYMRNVPHSNPALVVTAALLLISWFFHVIQQQKHDKAVKYLRSAAGAGLTLKNGGTKQTLELHKKAAELYEQHIAQCKYFFIMVLLLVCSYAYICCNAVVGL